MSELSEQEMNEDTGWSTATQIGIVTMILSCFVLYYYFGPTISELRGNKPQGSASSAPIDLVIGNERFVIPENYTQFPRVRRGGVRENVALHAMLPSYEPFSLSKREVFESHAPDSPIVHLQLESYRSPLTEEQQFERVYMRNVIDTNGKPGPYGLTVYEFRDDNGYKFEELFTSRDQDGDLIVIRCFKELADEPSHSCRRDMRLLPSVGLSYRFKRVHLAEWRDIDAGVQALALSFHRPSPLTDERAD